MGLSPGSRGPAVTTTEELIRRLAAEPRPAPSVGWGITLAAVPALLAAFSLLALGWGFRTDLGRALGDPVVAMKVLLPTLTALVAVRGARHLARPDEQTGGQKAALMSLVGMALGLLALSLIRTPPEAWGAAVRGQTLVVCLLSILTLAILPTLFLLLALRRGATLAPSRSGALAGLGGGASAAALFALHCTEDNPLFFVTWYGAAILITTVLGAILGPRLLRW